MDSDLNIRKQLAVVVLSVVGLSLLFRIADVMFSGVNWGNEDYVTAGLLVGGAGLLFVFTARKIDDHQTKRRLALIIVSIVALVWALLAVGFDGFEV